jgi:hypothetical protein
MAPDPRRGVDWNHDDLVRRCIAGPPDGRDGQPTEIGDLMPTIRVEMALRLNRASTEAGPE